MSWSSSSLPLRRQSICSTHMPSHERETRLAGSAVCGSGVGLSSEAVLHRLLDRELQQSRDLPCCKAQWQETQTPPCSRRHQENQGPRQKTVGNVSLQASAPRVSPQEGQAHGALEEEVPRSP